MKRKSIEHQLRGISAQIDAAAKGPFQWVYASWVEAYWARYAYLLREDTP